jgi:hypothetical protein
MRNPVLLLVDRPFPTSLTSVPEAVQRGGVGGADVAVRPLPGFDHVNSWIQAMPRAVTWFRSLD